MPYELTILGSSSATPTISRNPSAQFLFFGSQAYLLDCGEGTQVQIMKYGLKGARISRIFISHLHPDHYLGLVGLISSYSLKGRKNPLTIYAPEGLQEILDVQFRYAGIHLNYSLQVKVLPQAEGLTTLYEDGGVVIRCFQVEHRLPCWGFHFTEKKPAYKIRKNMALDGGLPLAAYPVLKSGKDHIAEDGTVYLYKTYTIPASPPATYTYITDTLYLPALAELLKEPQPGILYHEATFLNDLKDRATETYHSTAAQAAQFAEKAGARKLLIGHFSSRYNSLDQLLEEAQQIFPETELAEEGKSFSLRP